jgi:histidinol-phosphate phosphatase family protein
VRQAVILAGGKGTRLRERLGGLPKPLIDICGIPLLERQILLAKEHGFSRVLVLVNHAAEFIIEFCASRRNWGMDIECIDDGHPRGTAGATLAVYDRLDDEFLVMYGDTMLNVDLARFHSYHARIAGVSATLFLHPNDHPHDSDLVDIDDEGRILGFHPYPHDSTRYYPNLVNAALYWVSKQALLPWRRELGSLDFAKDLFPAMLRQGMLLQGYSSPEYIKDVGTPARLDKVCADFASGKIARSSLTHPQPMVFIDRDGTINREVDHLRSADQLELLPGAEAAIRRLNASEYRCCVVTNQPVIARGECSFEGMRQIHNKMETLLGRQGAYVDRIYVCPHHPDGGFPGERPELKTDCGCRKPKTGLIDRAVGDFNVARERSWLVGDSSIDMETARRSGLKSVLVETGYAGMDYRAWVTADATVPDLPAAVSHILDRYPRLLAYCSTLAPAIGRGAIVLIGGQSRSGKSTFACVLRDAIRERGCGALILAADRWLRDESKRQQGVLGRYDLAEMQGLLDALVDPARRPRTLRLSGYHKLKRERIESVESVSVAASDVILVEGTVALGLETGSKVETHRFHVESDEDARRRRVVAEYRLRGADEMQALKTYDARRSDEYPQIECLARGAVRVSLESIAA